MKYTTLAKNIVNYGFWSYVAIKIGLIVLSVYHPSVEMQVKTTQVNATEILKDIYTLVLLVAGFIYLKPLSKKYEAEIGDYDNIEPIVEIEIEFTRKNTED